MDGAVAARPMYGRVLLKLSGDAFSPASTNYGIDTEATPLLARQLAEVVDLGIQTAVVVGGGTSCWPTGWDAGARLDLRLVDEHRFAETGVTVIVTVAVTPPLRV